MTVNEKTETVEKQAEATRAKEAENAEQTAVQKFEQEFTQFVSAPKTVRVASLDVFKAKK